MIKRLICLIKGHRWGFWRLVAPKNSDVQYEKCLRCGKYKGDGETRLVNWIESE